MVNISNNNTLISEHTRKKKRILDSNGNSTNRINNIHNKLLLHTKQFTIINNSRTNMANNTKNTIQNKMDKNSTNSTNNMDTKHNNKHIPTNAILIFVINKLLLMFIF